MLSYKIKNTTIKRIIIKLSVLILISFSVIAISFSITACNSSYQDIADEFRDTHAAILSITVATVTIEDRTALNAAFSDYRELIADVRVLLIEERTLLGNLAARINELEVAVFITTHAHILSRTVTTLILADSTAVNAALIELESLEASVRAMLIDERILLDSLLVRLIALERASPETAATLFRETHKDVLALTIEYVEIADRSRIEMVLTIFNNQPDEAQELLAKEKALLDSLINRITRLEFENVPIRRELHSLVLSTYFLPNTEAEILDIETGITYRVRRVTGGFATLADVETLTREDTDRLRESNGGNWNALSARAIIVTIILDEVTGRRVRLAASIAPWEHKGCITGDTPFGQHAPNRTGYAGPGINLNNPATDNGMQGVVDIFFWNSHVPGAPPIQRHQDQVLIAASFTG